MEIICLQIDIARQKETIEYFKKFIDFAKEWGYNSVLVYIESAIRTKKTEFFDREISYSAEEISEIVAYSEKVGIDLIPAFENLSHLENFLRYPSLAEFSELYDPAAEPRNFSDGFGVCGCVSNEKMHAFLDEYISDVTDLFTSQYVHAGLDETFDFAVCPRCRKRLANGEDVNDLYYAHVMRTYNLVKSKGKTMMMWDDFFEYIDIVERLPRDIIFTNWNYEYVPDEPRGHWTNNIKSDVFRRYDELGFRYIFCTWAFDAARLYNVDSFTDYAKRYNPMGAMATTWERAARFYFSSYPIMAYSGALWNGKVKTYEDKVSIYEKFFGSRECAELVIGASMCPVSCFGNVTDRIEDGGPNFYRCANQITYVKNELKKYMDNAPEGMVKDVLSDFYCNSAKAYCNLMAQKLGMDVFRCYDTGEKRYTEFKARIEEIKSCLNEVKEITQKLWDKHRPGIKSQNNAFPNGIDGQIKKYCDIDERLKAEEEHGVLSVDLSNIETHGTPYCRIDLKYEGEDAPVTVYYGPDKPNLVSGGYYGLRFAIANKKIEHMDFSAYGEGATAPMNFRYTAKGVKYGANEIEVLAGNVEHPEKTLSNDTRFAIMGYDDGVAHFRDVSLSKIKSTVRVRFKKL